MADSIPLQANRKCESSEVTCEDTFNADQCNPTLQELMQADQSLDDICFKFLESLGINRDTIVSLLTDDSYTDEWQLHKFKSQVWQQFIFWHGVIAVIEESNELSFKDNMPIIFENLDFSKSVVNISSFVRKIRNKMKLATKKRDATFAQELAIGVIIKDVGPICERENINLNWLQNPVPLSNSVNVTKGLVCELRRVRIHHSIPLKKVSLWVKYLCLLEYLPDPDYLKRQMEKLYSKKQNFLKIGKTERHDAFISEKYMPPLKQSVSDSSSTVTVSVPLEHKDDTNSKSLKVTETVQNNKIESIEFKYMKTREQKLSANLQLYNLRKEYKKLKETNDKNQSKLSEFSTRNVNKRLKRKQNRITELQLEKNKIEREIKNMKERNLSIKQKSKSQVALLKYYKQKSKIKNRTVFEKPVSTSVNETDDLGEEITFLQNENEKLRETIDELMKSQSVEFFQDGKYNDSVREVYATLLSMNVGVKNVEKLLERY